MNDPQKILTEFAKCSKRKLMRDGSLEIHCKRGLWSVSGPCHAAVEREALHYFRQYHDDGEYVGLRPNGKMSK